MKTREVITALKADGWYQVSSKGHLQFKHPTKSGRVTVSFHSGNAELPPKTLASIETQAGIRLRNRR